MTVHLLVPNLLWPAAAGAAPDRDLALPGLEGLLARGHLEKTAGTSRERWLAGAFGLPGTLPLAPYALSGDGGDPEEAWWMQADPVHLRFHRDQLFLADASQFALDADEAREFIASLNTHFAQDGLTFIAPSPRRWYLRVAAEPRIATRPTSEVAGRGVAPFLPEGADATRWRRVFNETQMLLHEHPRNQSRESRGALTVNSVWFWGAGRHRALDARHDTVWSDRGLPSGLASASGARTEPLPAEAGWPLPPGHSSNGLVVLSALPAPSYGDVGAWREALSALEARWFAPIAAALKDGRVDRLALHGLGPERSIIARLNRRDCYRFWRRRRPLGDYAA